MAGRELQGGVRTGLLAAEEARMMLHQESLALAAFVVSLALTFALTATGAILRGQAGLRWWILALWLAAGGSVLLGLRGRLPEAIPVLGGHALLSLSAALSWVGAREFCGKPPRLRWAFGLVGLYLAIHAQFLLGFPSLSIRSLNYAVMAAGWNLAIAWCLFFHAPEGLSRSSRLVAALFLLDALCGGGAILFKFQDSRDPARLDGLASAHFLVGLMLGTLEVMGFVLLLSHRLLAQVREAARRDGLTGVFNRRALDEEATRLIEVCRRQGIPCSLAMVDLDHFKELNDRFGHAAGDAALRHVADLLQRGLRKVDLLGRYGGEEFCIVMPGTSAEQARGVADRLLDGLALSPLSWEGRDIPLGFSVGLSCSDGGEAGDYPALQARSDRCLYRARPSEGTASKQSRWRAHCEQEEACELASGGAVHRLASDLPVSFRVSFR